MRNILILLLVFCISYGNSFAETYYSLVSGDWNIPGNWSNTGYEGPPSTTFPDANIDNVYIGSNRTMTLDQDRQLGTVLVEYDGTMVFGENVLTGNEFILGDGGKIVVGHPEGINLSGATGNIQTGIRTFNELNHNNGRYVYSGNAAHTGDGIADQIASIEIAVDGAQTIQLDKSIIVNGDVLINSGVFNSAGFNITLSGNWTNNSEFIPLNSIVTFNGNNSQTIGGTGLIEFGNVTLEKNAGRVDATKDLKINTVLRLIFNSVLNIQENTLTLGENNALYSDTGNGQDFTATKCIQCGTGAKVVREIQDGSILPLEMLFPISTMGPIYTPAKISYKTGAIFSDASLSVQINVEEHPEILKENVSLSRYWTIETAGTITTGSGGADLEFYYDDDDISGAEDEYRVLQYSGGAWIIEPGTSSNEVAYPINKISATKVNDPVAGDWTAGQLNAVRRVFYSRASGAYSEPATWSLLSHEGSGSTFGPGSPNDLVIIGHEDVVTLTDHTLEADEIVVDNLGTLITGEFTVSSLVNKFTLNDGGTLYIGSPSGIKLTEMRGNIQAVNRSYSDDATYVYTDIGNQYTGDGLPEKVRALIIDKETDEYTVSLSNAVAISDSLVILKGELDQTTNLYSLAGETPGRTFVMRGGKLLLHHLFPENFTPPVLTAGEIEYTGLDGISVPGKMADNGVIQYNDLVISGNRGSSAITFDSGDTITIHGKFDISDLEFSPFEGERFITEGSTIRFNGDVPQFAPRMCKTDSPWVRLNYYNLHVSGTDTTFLADTNHIITNELRILPGATFAQNGRGLEIHGKWINIQGDFVYDMNKPVHFIAEHSDSVLSVIPDDDPFYDVDFTGPGAFMILGNMTVDNDFNILAGGNVFGNTANISIKGNWNNLGVFDPETSTVRFAGSADQYIVNDTDEEFYNLNIDNGAALNFSETDGRYISVLNKLYFNSGVINADNNNRFVSVDSNVVRPGAGHVNGRLRIKTPEGNTDTLLFAIGTSVIYRPLSASFKGTGGDEGYLLAYTEETDKDFFDSDGGSGLNWTYAVQKRWSFDWFPGEEGALGIRTYNLTIGYEETDLTVDANPMLFNVRRKQDGAWNAPLIGEKTETSIEALENDGFGYFIIGHSLASAFYSIADGAWSNPNVWSTDGYSGISANSVPNGNSEVKIGNGKKITLDQDFATNNDGKITIENSGHLVCGEKVLSGNGSFELMSGATLESGSADGLSETGTSGNVQTWTRNYNVGDHKNSTIIYSGADGQKTGSLTTYGFLVINGQGTVELSDDITVYHDLTINSGSLNAGTDGRAITINGNWINNAEFVPMAGDSKVIFEGDADQEITQPEGQAFNSIEINKTGGKATLLSSDLLVGHELKLDEGVLDSRTNDQNVKVLNTGYVTGGGGFVDGKLTRFFANNDTGPITFDVGSDVRTLMVVEINGIGGTEGYLTATAFGEDHADIASSKLDTDKNVQRYWSLAADNDIDIDQRTYDVTVQFVNPDDLRNGANPQDFIMQSYEGNSWNDLTIGAKTVNSTKATGLTVFNSDFAVGPTKGDAVDETMLGNEAISRIYPNPVSGKTTIEFNLKQNSNVELAIYDLNGRKMRTLFNGFLSEGTHSIDWTPDLNNGLYYYIVKSNHFEATRKIIISK